MPTFVMSKLLVACHVSKHERHGTPSILTCPLPAQPILDFYQRRLFSVMERNSPPAPPKWEGKVSARLNGAVADQIWPLFKDFFNFHEWFPGLATSYGIHGTNGEPGCIRYCAGFSIPSDSGDDSVSWSNERLISVDDDSRSLSYEIVDCNIGFESYVATVTIVPQGDEGQAGCVIEWSFTVDPVEGWVRDDLVGRYEVGLQRMAQRMEDALRVGMERDG